MAGPGRPAPCCPPVVSVQDAVHVADGDQDDVIIQQVLDGVVQHLTVGRRMPEGLAEQTPLLFRV